MTSVIRSDCSISSRFFDGRTGLTVSAVDRFANNKEVRQLSAVVGNGARDTALQINGHVAENVKNNSINIKYLIVSCQCNASKAVATTMNTPPLSGVMPLQTSVSSPEKHSPLSNDLFPMDMIPLPGQRRNMTVISKATGRRSTFCVTSSRDVKESFISQDIVNRLGFRTNFQTARVNPSARSKKAASTTHDFVDLSFSIPGSAENIARRFRVLKDCPFDMLLGTSATDTSLN